MDGGLTGLDTFEDTLLQPQGRTFLRTDLDTGQPTQQLCQQSVTNFVSSSLRATTAIFGVIVRNEVVRSTSIEFDGGRPGLVLFASERYSFLNILSLDHGLQLGDRCRYWLDIHYINKTRNLAPIPLRFGEHKNIGTDMIQQCI